MCSNEYFHYIKSFILNWNNYFITIPVWTIISLIIIKIQEKEVTGEGLFKSIAIGLVNPLATILLLFCIPAAFVMAILVCLWLLYDKIKDKKIF